MLDSRLYKQLVEMPHRQYLGLITKVRCLINRKEQRGEAPPVGTPDVVMALYELGTNGFDAFRQELSMARVGRTAKMKRVALENKRKRRALYMKEYRKRKRATLGRDQA